MSADLIKYAFVAGELSEQLYGRSDLEKFDLGLAEGYNWFVDYRGGISTRPGSEFVDYVQHDDKPTKYIPFKYAPDLANTYLILMGDGYIRFIQDGAYVLEADKIIIGISQANPGVVSIVAHGFTAGDWVYLDEIAGMTELNGQLVQVGTTAAGNFAIKDVFGNNIDTTNFTAWSSSGVANRVYTVAHTYDVDDLADLQFNQRRDYIRLTHPSYHPRNLVRSGHTSWALSIEELDDFTTRPTGLSGAASSTGLAQAGFIITAVFEDGTESAPSNMFIIDTIVDYTVTAGSVAIAWTAVANAKYYNVYRTNVITVAPFVIGPDTVGGITKGDQVGYIGRSDGPSFTDSNIIPDFVKTPPRHFNPFANSSVEHITITGPGSGYPKRTTTVAVTGAPGSGFQGYPVINEDGEILAVTVIYGGDGYVTPVVSFIGVPGTLATATAALSPATGNYPRTSVVFQQRQWYAATNQKPLTMFASRPGLFDNMDQSQISAPNDSLEFDIDSEEVAPILHLIDVRGGMLAMSQTGIWLVRAASAIGAAITPNDILADPQTSRGASAVKPLLMDTDILYVEGKNVTVRLLSYSDAAKSFVGQDMSILSNHLFGTDKLVERMENAQNPHNLVWARRSDGVMLAFTLVKEQDVYAWMPCATKGFYTDHCVIHENGRDSVYLMVQRYVNGRWTKFIERMAPREFTVAEEAWCVDCGLETESTFPAAGVVFAEASGVNILVTADTAIFASGDVGSVIRAGGGKAIITAFTNTTNVRVTIQRPITDLINETETPWPFEEGEWTMNAPFNIISGLEHLEGEVLSILADGNVITPKEVVDGEIDLGVDVTLARAGIGYTCRARTLPLTAGDAAIENKRLSVIGTAVRIHDTRGLKTGSALNKLRPMRERTDEGYGEAIRLQSELKHMLIESDWDEHGQTYYVQEDPLPATVIGIVAKVDIGDLETKTRR